MPTGEKTKELTKEIKDKLLLLFRLGYKEKDACTYVGVTIYALNSWIEKGEITKDEILFAQHALRNLSVGTVAAIIQGEKGGVDKDGKKIKSKMENMIDPRVSLEAAKWWLEYKHSKEFSKMTGMAKFLDGVDIAQLIVEANKLDRKEKKKLENMKVAEVTDITPENKND